MLLDFFQSTYEAGATRGGWDRARLERPLITFHRAAGDASTRDATAPEQPAPAP